MIQINLAMAASLVSVMLAAIALFGRLLLGVYDKRLKERHDELTASLSEHIDRVNQMERDWLRWQAELPMHYVRREDYVRGQTIIEAKLDAIAIEQKRLLDRTAINRSGDSP